jgi:hypothetical protein
MTTESRDVFETVFKKEYPHWVLYERDDTGYQAPLVDSGFKIWQAGIEYGYKQAADVAELKTRLEIAYDLVMKCQAHHADNTLVKD